MTVRICGIPYKIIECEDNFDVDLHFGEIKYDKGEIHINKSLTNDIKEEALCHEIMHGILVHLGYNEQSQDEQFVQAVSNAIHQTFRIIKKGENDE
jgi:hypothetical protein